jgi:hypothetical protein
MSMYRLLGLSLDIQVSNKAIPSCVYEYTFPSLPPPSLPPSLSVFLSLPSLPPLSLSLSLSLCLSVSLSFNLSAVMRGLNSLDECLQIHWICDTLCENLTALHHL